MMGQNALSIIWRSTLFRIIIFIAIILLTACNNNSEANLEILIGIEPAEIPLLHNIDEPNPTQTGIPSLDALNKTWEVSQMIPLYPDIAPDDEIAARYGLSGVFRLVVPGNTDLEQMITEYTADSHIQYAELNKPAQINEK